MLTDGIIKVCGALIICISSFLIDFRAQDYRPSFQPRGAAFYIWVVIFILLFLSAGAAFKSELNLISSVSLLVSCVLCSLWLRFPYKSVSMFILISACLSAAVSTIFDKNVLSAVGPALLTGWLTIASALGTAIHLKKYRNFESRYVVIPFVLLNSICSFISSVYGNQYSGYVIASPLLWSAIFSKVENAALFAFCGLFEISFLLGWCVKKGC